ncbi:beta-hexosaminidase subunit beta-like [Anneissia japonica]|uniref:beta-hexosaminidase subunit beta-like n=1 Tax=Anneissia japonica TaxID=1529436 RepID=UPI001425A914|nr:beta-hexosaminidase subunit beta-like [Anneissia japonica]
MMLLMLLYNCWSITSICVISWFSIPSLAKPTVFSTVGEPWPMPMQRTVSDITYNVSPETFCFNHDGVNCDLLQQAFQRYYNIIFYGTIEAPSQEALDAYPLKGDGEKQQINSLIVTMTTCPEYPSDNSNEEYSLTVHEDTSNLESESIWGVLRGLETFSQLIYIAKDGRLTINATDIVDRPRFPYRGLLLDTSRHFLDVSSLLKNLDAMAYSKLNVFHFHIVDNPSFPYQSSTFPNLSQQGAYSPNHVYTQDDIDRIIEYARVRGIRVIPEFDTPGHTESWHGIQNLLVPCYTDNVPNGLFGPVDPTEESTYMFLTELYKEIKNKFPDGFIHLGGDEVKHTCWASNPRIVSFMEAQGFNNNFTKLEGYYDERITQLADQVGLDYIVWQEVIDIGAKVPQKTIALVWKDADGGYVDELAKVTAKGHRAILSSPWYLNRVKDPHTDPWKKYYKVDPQNFPGTKDQKKLVIGGEACMWGEYVDDTNVIPRTWPMASVIAERLWSPKDLRDPKAAASRLAEHKCRLVWRGLQAQSITGPGFCPQEWNSREHDKY